jgi:N-acetylneuraminic acid mutarotase
MTLGRTSLFALILGLASVTLPPANTTSLSGDVTLRGAWKRVAPMAEPRSFAASVLLRDGRALVVGGFGPNLGRLRDAEVYDPLANRWSDAGDFGSKRQVLVTALLPDGRVFLGGDLNLTAVELYDPLGNTWTRDGNMPMQQANAATVTLRDGRVVFIGGCGGDCPMATVQAYVPSTSTWSRLANMSAPRSEASATVLADGRVLVMGGRSEAGGLPLATAEVYDPATNGWTAAAPMATPRQIPITILLPTGRVLLVGGNGGSSLPLQPLATAELYDPASNSWSEAGTMSIARSGEAATLLPDGQVLVTGGYPPVGRQALASAEIYDPHSNGWSPVASMTVGRAGHVAALLKSGQVLVVGGALTAGRSSGTVLASAEIFDLSGVTLAPAPRAGVADLPLTTLVLGGVALVLAVLVGLSLVVRRRSPAKEQSR